MGLLNNAQIVKPQDTKEIWLGANKIYDNKIHYIVTTRLYSYYSADGINYTKYNPYPYPSWFIGKLSNDHFISFYPESGDRYMTKSSDLQNWQRYESPTKKFNVSSAVSEQGKVICCGSGGSYGTGYHTAYTIDGVNWILSTATRKPFHDIAYGNGKFFGGVMVNNITYFFYSSDGINWSETSYTKKFVPIGLCYGNGKYIAFNYQSTGSANGNVALSLDGINWDFYYVTKSQYYTTRCVFGKNIFVGINHDHVGTIIYSSDGLNWANVTGLLTNRYWKACCFTGEKFVAISNGLNYVAVSYDGINWNEIQTQINESEDIKYLYYF